MENLKKALKSIINLVRTVETSLEDEKINIVEGVNISVGSFKLWQAVKEYKGLYEAYKALNEEEKAELIEWFGTEFDIKNNDIEFVIEQVFAGLLSFNSILKA